MQGGETGGIRRVRPGASLQQRLDTGDLVCPDNTLAGEVQWCDAVLVPFRVIRINSCGQKLP